MIENRTIGISKLGKGNQAVIPKRVRRQLALQQGDRLRFVWSIDGRVWLAGPTDAAAPPGQLSDKSVFHSRSRGVTPLPARKIL